MSDRTMIVLDNANEDTVRNNKPLPIANFNSNSLINGTYWGTSNVASSTAGAIYWNIRTPNTTTLHFVSIDVSTEHATAGGSTIALYDNAPTITTTNTNLTVINNNLADTVNTTTAKVYYGTAYDSSLTSTNLLETHALSGDYPDISMRKYILNTNSDYTLKYTGVASNTTAHVNISWGTL